MSEKHLTEESWKSLAKKKKITKDGWLGKALADFEEAEETDYAARLTELEDVKAKAKKLLKEYEDDKEVEDYLGEILAQAEKTRKAIEAEQKGGAKEEEEEEEDEEAAEYRKDLPTKLKSALNQVKARAPGAAEPGEEAMPQLKFMAYVAGKPCAVLVARKVGSTTKKLLLEIAGGSTGGKYHKGECIFEKNLHTFVLDPVPPGLARKLATALLSETGMKYKVRVRSTDGSVDLDSDSDTDPDVIPAAPPPPAAPTPAVPAAEGMAKFTDRLRGLVPQIKANPNLKVFPGTPEEKAVGVVAVEAGAAAKKKDFAQAHELLDVVHNAVNPPAEAAASAAPVEAALPIWLGAKEAVDAQLSELYSKLRKSGLPVLSEVADEIENVLVNFRVGLVSALTDFDQASGPKKEAARAKALEVITNYQAQIPQDKHIIAADTNPFGIKVTARETLASALAELSTKLKAA